MAEKTTIELTPAMLKAGLDVLYESGRIEVPMLGADEVLIKELFSAVEHARQLDQTAIHAAHCVTPRTIP